MKKYLIFILILLLGAGAVFGIYFVVKQKQSAILNTNLNLNATKDDDDEFDETTPSDKRCAVITDTDEKKACERSDYDSWLIQIRDRASSEKNQEICQLIPNAIDRDICYLELVYDLPKAEVCEKIIDAEIKVSCENRLIHKSDDINNCAQIATEAERRYCLEVFMLEESTAGEEQCPKLSGELADTCWEIYYTRRGLESSDYDWCKKIKTTEGQKNCLRKMPTDTDGDGLSDYLEISLYRTNPQNSDTDGDGLSDYEEVKIFKTDPNNPDTDGDGFTDGEEVKSGYNPLGPGKL